MKYRDFTYCLFTRELNVKFKNHCKKNGLRIWRELESAMKMYLEAKEKEMVTEMNLKVEQKNECTNRNKN